MLITKEEIIQFIEYIENYDTIIIHRHVRPDPDAVGSQLGLKVLLESAFPNKRILAAGTITEGLSWMGRMDEVKSEDYEEALVIVTDTANQDRIDGKQYDQGQKLIKIDHHLIVDAYGDLQMAYPEATSASQLITEIALQSEGHIPLTVEASKLLYAGIVADTGRFLYNPTPETFEMAMHLVTYPIDTRKITDQFSEKSVEEARFEGYAYQNIQFYDEGVASLVITRDIMRQYGITEEATNIVLTIPSNVTGMYTWVNFIEQEGDNPKYRVRLRSKGPAINGIAEAHDGGGHAMASGAKADSEEEMNEIINELKQITQEYRQTNK
ncbi:bifunctional oligoribonuclease/PAP phosphatase NrnA [Aerococcaceae bacterium DSM 111020]|nr:bifunctional oligoribonuclease/PAP phosphatase NrnA [Aerococcaceae bacterium DSM 111020]